MFRHYITIALRNIRKYALQNAVSILGLTAGFVCLTLSTVWIRYENSFDTFHKDADRLYYMNEIYEVDGTDRTDRTKYVAGALGIVGCYDFETLIEFAEIESCCKYVIKERKGVTTLRGDTAFFKMFDFKIAAGTDRFKTDSSYVAVTENFAHKIYGYENPIGKKCNGKTVGAVIAPFKRPSIFRFDILMWHDFPFVRPHETSYHSVQTEDWQNNVIIKLHKGIDYKEFSDKLDQTIKAQSYGRNPYRRELRPLQEFHRHNMKNGMYIQYIHSGLFATACLLLLVCAIVNYMLFSLNRIRNRAREMALRMVHGAKVKDILSIFTREHGAVFVVSSAAAFMVGYLVIRHWQQQFLRQATVSWWIYAAILAAMALVICLTVGHRVLKATRENPADVIKSE